MKTINNKQVDLMIDKVAEIDAIDGYAIFDEDCVILDNSIPEEFLGENTGFVLRDIISSNIKVLEDSENTVLLTEMGAWFLAKVAQNYLLILAGNKKPVDIPNLIKKATEIKTEIFK